MLKQLFCALTLVYLSFTGSSAARAGILVTYNFAGEHGDQLSSTGTVKPSGIGIVTSSVLTRSAGIALANGPHAISASNWAIGALNTSKYFSLSLTTQPGATMSLDTIQFEHKSDGKGPNSFAVRSSLDGFGSNLLSGTSSNSSAQLATVHLDSHFANLTNSIEFRLYGYDASKESGNWQIGSSQSLISADLSADLIVTGSGSGPSVTPTSAPEPATMGAFGLFGIAGGVSAWLKRRKKVAK